MLLSLGSPLTASVIEIRRIWKEYQLEPRTRFNTPVTSVHRVEGTGEHLQEDPSGSQSKWIVNDGEDGEFDAVVVTVGTCGEPKRIKFPGLPSSGEGDSDSGEDGKHQGKEEVFEGDVFHSSELDDAPLEGQRIIVIGSGASGVEAVETALSKGATGCVMIARDDKVGSLSCVRQNGLIERAHSGSSRGTWSSTRSSPLSRSGERCHYRSYGRRLSRGGTTGALQSSSRPALASSRVPRWSMTSS